MVTDSLVQRTRGQLRGLWQLYRQSGTARDLLRVLSGNIMAQGLAFLAVILVSRDLGPARYGEFALLIAIFTFITQLSDFGTSTSYVTHLSRRREQRARVLGTVLIFKLLAGTLLAALMWVLAPQISQYFFERDAYASYFRLAAPALLFHALLGTLVAHCQALEQFRLYNLLNVAHHGLRCLSIVTVLLVADAHLHFSVFVYIYFFAAAIVTLSIVWRFNIIFVFEWLTIRAIYQLGFWIFLSSIAVLIMMRIDMVMLKKLAGAEQVGLYSVASNVAMALPLVTMSLTATLMPKMAELMEGATIRAFVVRVMRHTKYVLAVSVLLQLLSPLLIYGVFGAAYANSVPVLVVLVLSYMFGVIVNPISLIYYQIGKSFMLTAVNWAQLLIGYGCNLLLIPALGATGAAISSLTLHIFSSSVIVGYLYFSAVGNRGLEPQNA